MASKVKVTTSFVAIFVIAMLVAYGSKEDPEQTSLSQPPMQREPEGDQSAIPNIPVPDAPKDEPQYRYKPPGAEAGRTTADRWTSRSPSSSPDSVIQSSTQTKNDVRSLVALAAKKAALPDDEVSGVTAEESSSGYSLTIHFIKDSQPAGEADAIILTQAFVDVLVAQGLDPTQGSHPKFVNTCGYEEGHLTATGKPGVIPTGCAHFNPYKDQIR